jgi:outer membrane protein assembly factor BamB
MGFLMRCAANITSGRWVLPLFALVFLSACSSASWLDAPVTAGAADWTQEGGNAQRTHAHTQFPGTGVDEWEFSLDGLGGGAGMLLRGGTVFFPSVSMIVEAVALGNAGRIGGFKTDGINTSTPAILDACLFTATMAADARISCFDLTTGKSRWVRRTGAIAAALCAHDGQLFAVSIGGTVSCFTPADSLERWKIELDTPVHAAPAAVDTVLVVAAANGDLHGLSVRDGRQIWRRPTLAALQAGPVILESRVVAVNRAGRVMALDVHTGELLWEQPGTSPVYYTPAAQHNRILVPFSSGVLLLLDAETGGILRSIDIGELPGASPQIVDGTAYQLARKGLLFRIDLESGEYRVVHTLPLRSETPPLLTPLGIILVDEYGEAVMVRDMPDAENNGRNLEEQP